MSPSPGDFLTRMTLEELTALSGSRARALEILRWLYKGPLPEALPERLTGVAQSAWARVREKCVLPSARVETSRRSEDGTTKLLVALEGTTVESVLIPSRNRSTVCVSSQSGCTRRCAFCATATLGFQRQLDAGEIVAQYLLARAEAPKDAPATNVVFMGMGEPMDNLDEVLRAVRVLTQAPAPRLGAEQITVSTSGVLPGMRRFLAESKASFALSLNATTDAQRAQLMPHDRTWPIAALLGLLREDAAAHPWRTHFVEYVLFEGVNDSDEDADRLAALLKELPARVNLIPHNPGGGNPALKAPSEARVRAFQRRLAGLRQRAFIRWPKGREIAAACGQLARDAKTALAEKPLGRSMPRAAEP